ncbi:2TM domain-containing protein, partial [Mycobacterium sp.]|uniref:2TM domain-containing protein n=1 Tax=Mycobacterium sp. TaxID=1785 RepID=UPI003F95E2BD
HDRIRRHDPRRHAARVAAARLAVRIHLGAYLAMAAIVLSVWAAVAVTTGDSYFWPIWPILGGAIGLAGHALSVPGCRKALENR